MSTRIALTSGVVGKSLVGLHILLEGRMLSRKVTEGNASASGAAGNRPDRVSQSKRHGRINTAGGRTNCWDIPEVIFTSI